MPAIDCAGMPAMDCAGMPAIDCGGMPAIDCAMLLYMSCIEAIDGALVLSECAKMLLGRKLDDTAGAFGSDLLAGGLKRGCSYGGRVASVGLPP